MNASKFGVKVHTVLNVSQTSAIHSYYTNHEV